MGKKEENIGFVCKKCSRTVMPLRNGGYRKHCPFCLASLHVDAHIPGDRKSKCRGLMEASGIQFSGNKGWQIIHKCQNCGIERLNKIAEGDAQPDDWAMVVQLTNGKSLGIHSRR